MPWPYIQVSNIICFRCGPGINWPKQEVPWVIVISSLWVSALWEKKQEAVKGPGEGACLVVRKEGWLRDIRLEGEPAWVTQGLVCFPRVQTVCKMPREPWKVSRKRGVVWSALHLGSTVTLRSGLIAGKPGGRCVKNKAVWEGQLQNLQGPVENENVGCFFKTEKKCHERYLKGKTFSFFLWSLLTCQDTVYVLFNLGLPQTLIGTPSSCPRYSGVCSPVSAAFSLPLITGLICRVLLGKVKNVNVKIKLKISGWYCGVVNPKWLALLRVGPLVTTCAPPGGRPEGSRQEGGLQMVK